MRFSNWLRSSQEFTSVAQFLAGGQIYEITLLGFTRLRHGIIRQIITPWHAAYLCKSSPVMLLLHDPGL